MNCFEWQARSSDYLDGTLIGPLKTQADSHLEECAACNRRHKHYRMILSSISSQPRSTLPVPIRKSPFGASLPRLDSRFRRSRWDRTPWYIRTSIEGIAVASTILFVVAMVPRIRSFYEKSLEHKLDAFQLGDSEATSAGESADSAPLARGNLARPENPPAHDDFSGENESDTEEEEVTTGPDVRVGSSEIWRFNLKTDSPREIRPRIVSALKELGLRSDTPGVGGIEAPGGIQFDLLVPQSAVPSLKNQLQRLSQAHGASTQGTHEGGTPFVSEAFTWYKNKSRRKIPAGKARVVIWLSQM